MLRIYDIDRRMGRREMLRIGGLGLGGLTLPGLLSARNAFAAQTGSTLSGRSVVFLFMHGGPSQIETFDPKMSAPTDIRSQSGEIQTSLPGITFGSTLPKLASMAHRLSVVRSYVPGDANHDIKPIVCKDTFGANIGTLYSRVAGLNHSVTGMPTNAVLFPRAVDPNTLPGVMNFGRFDSTGTIGAGYTPFIPGAGGDLQKDMELRLPMDRLGDRRALLSGLDRLRVSLDASGKSDGTDTFRDQAFRTILGGIANAFDLSQEDPALLARYDTAPLVRPDQISRKWNNYNNYVDHAKTLGKLMLLARRLCERGCGFVTVTTSFVWDMHADVNNATVEEGMRYMGTPFDHAVSAFIEDVANRGLSDRILLVCCGEMGRTPRVNKNGGRDHWGNLGPMLMAGGGLRMGQVVGQSSRDGGEPFTEPVRIKNVMATIFHQLFDIGVLRITRGIPSPVLQAATGADPIVELV